MFLIVGGDSEIGAAAFRAMKAQGKAVAATTRRREHVAPDRPFLDLAAPLDDWALPPRTQAVCLCAAIARLAACADDPAASAHINVAQTLALAEKLLARGIAVLFLSTNQVFDGRTPFQRAEAPHSPISEYGRQKARAEAALLRQMENGAPVAILRLAKVMSDTMPLIGGWIKDLTAAKPIRVFNDLALAPTPTDLVCTAIARLAARPRSRHLSAHRTARCHLCRYRPLSRRISRRRAETCQRDERARGRSSGGCDAAQYDS